MSKPINKTMIGFFVVGAIALLVVAIGVLGSGKLFKQRFHYHMVFEGSVKGLNVGAPVVLRGVKIGAVSDIQMHFEYASKSITILVYTEFEKGRVVTANLYEELAKTLGDQTQYTVMKELVGRGLRAQLEMQSIVTGQLQIALDFHPDKAAVYNGIDTTVQEILTIPTPLQQLVPRTNIGVATAILFKQIAETTVTAVQTKALVGRDIEGPFLVSVRRESRVRMRD